jgi:hypothetical protein
MYATSIVCRFLDVRLILYKQDSCQKVLQHDLFLKTVCVCTIFLTEQDVITQISFGCSCLKNVKC